MTPVPRVPPPRVPPPRVVVLLGVAGSGKTTVGRALAARVGWAFEDADAYHGPASNRKMAAGVGLTDADRAPWLDALAQLVGDRAEGGPPTVLACSALRARYRDQLGAGRPDVAWVWLDVPPGVLAARLARRQGNVAGPRLLPSQLATFEPPAEALRLDGTRAPDDLAAAVEAQLGLGGAQPQPS